MSFKSMMLVLTVTVVLIIASLLSVSYAWYGFSNNTSNISVSVGGQNIVVVFAQSEYISTVVGIPLLANQVATMADSSVFSVTRGNELSSYDVAVGISLVDIEIENPLKCSDFRYELFRDGVSQVSGNFADIGNNTTLDLISMGEIGTGSYNYEFRVWLNETGIDQSSLMGSYFAAKIKVSSAIKTG